MLRSYVLGMNGLYFRTRESIPLYKTRNGVLHRKLLQFSAYHPLASLSGSYYLFHWYLSLSVVLSDTITVTMVLAFVP